ncbi:hypothetical protein L596_028901 [Steinernema carpocapsae]|uniref:Amine oxidase domain-containing protein n=1 Tax=Steinernema carpocapsae TaxID=34508 RepID=A0A4U5LZP4_STECR|nr:hypothetical protein L596_028901 [Steinernema carpocapsae]
MYPKKFDHVIGTSPFGHLKKFAKTMFSPQLSNHKLAAIEALGYGNLLKVFLIYEKLWWHYKGSSIAALRVKG